MENTLQLINLILVGIALLLSLGCQAIQPSAEEIANADYGLHISQDEAEAKAVEYLRGRLKDPSTATYKWDPVYKSWLTEAPLAGGKNRFGYRLDGKVNSKNSIGGFTGFLQYWFVFYNGEIVSVYSEAPSGFGYLIMKKQL